MSKVLTDPQNYTDIANAIRSKGGTSAALRPNQMSAAISAIVIPTEAKIYIGASAPNNSTGNNGDLYLRTS